MVVRVNGSTGIVTVSGTSGAPSLRGPDGNSGISFDGDQVIISSSGLSIATITDSVSTITNLSIDTTNFEFSPGSSGTPTIAASGDLNTGIYFPAADTIGFTEGGNEAARFDSSGRLGIGSTNPTRPLTVATPSGQTVNILGVFDSSNANPATVSNCVIAFSDPTSTGGQFSTRLGSIGDSLAFYTNGANERVRITSSGDLRFNSGFGSVATAYGVRAWANWRGDISSGGNSQISGSANVTSVTDNGTGDYTINFTNAMPDGNYVVVGNCMEDFNGTRGDHFLTMQRTQLATGSCRVTTINAAGTVIDDDFVWAAIIR